jgi:FkbM family methyltransferase
LYGAFKRKQDAQEIAMIREVVKQGDVVLDIGSNIGFYSQLLSDLVGSTGKVHCFEPDRNNFARLQEALRGRTNVVLNNAAVSDTGGELTLYTSHRTYAPEQYESSYTVPAIRIDDYLPAPATVNFIKMDIQGAEYLALKGMELLLQRSQRTAMIFELAPDFLFECSKVTDTQLLQLLQCQGMEISQFTETGLRQGPVQYATAEGTDKYANLFAVKKHAHA